MKESNVNSTSWTYCQYTQGDLRALITLGASPDILDDSFSYYSTVLDQDNVEVFQAEFNTLEKACEYINDRYKDDWDFLDANAPKVADASGCSTCAAH